MKNRRLLTAMLSLLMLCSATFHLSSCVPVSPIFYVEVDAFDLMEGIEPDPDIKTASVSGSSAKKAADFAARLLQNCREDGKNVLISPVSLLAALAMTANGAQGETRSQMEKTLGMTTDELNVFFKAYADALLEDEKSKLDLANSIWFRDDDAFKVNPDFLQVNANYFCADAYKADFDDQTLKDINNWVKNNTDGMIPEILDRIGANAVMYLINALAFDAEWSEIYKETSVKPGKFTLEDGTERDAVFMYSTESKYLETEKSVGFVKDYAGGSYAFAAFLPKEGCTLNELIGSLDGQTITRALSGIDNVGAVAGMPKFETDYSIEMSKVLSDMGMTLAFDEDRADFSGLAVSEGNIYINRVIHKTYISVAEKGTKAGAASAVEMYYKGVLAPESEKTVYLDRPFVYMLIDTENNVPLFIGTLADVG